MRLGVVLGGRSRAVEARSPVADCADRQAPTPASIGAAYDAGVSRTTIPALPLVEVRRQPGGEGADRLVLATVQGDIPGRYHCVGGGVATRGVVWLPGTGEGLEGPARGLYAALARDLQARAVESLRIDYRRVNRVEECVRDALVACRWLSEERGLEHLVLVGHGLGGVAAILAAASAEEVRAVAALSPPATAEEVAVTTKPLFLGHGGEDVIAPAPGASRSESRSAAAVTRRIYPGAGNDLDACREALAVDLLAWLDEQW